MRYWLVWTVTVAAAVLVVLTYMATVQAAEFEDSGAFLDLRLNELDQAVIELDERLKVLEAGEPPIEPPIEPPVEPPVGVVHLGLHVTQGELDIWRERAITGPYVERGDQSPNSIDDWNRIVKHKKLFVADTRFDFQADHWENTFPDGCYKKYVGSGWQLKWYTLDAMNAAFFAMVQQDHAVKIMAHDWLMAQAAHLDFSDRSKWCLGKLNREHLAFIGGNITRMIFAMDYLTALDPDLLSPDEEAAWKAWINSLAEVQMDASERQGVARWPGRPDDYTPPTVPYMSTAKAIPFFGGDGIPWSMRDYNNRTNSAWVFLGVAGAYLDRQDYIDEAKTMFRETMMFGYNPQGYWGDFQRWRDSAPDLGLWYSASYNYAFALLADMLARRGDFELYEYSTSDGINGSEGGPKSLLTSLRHWIQYGDNTFERYGTDDPGRNGNQAFRIDNRAVRSGSNLRQGFHFGSMIVANYWYHDQAIREFYTRGDTAAPNFVCCYYDKQDVNLGYPAPWFMWGMMDDLVDPYAR